MLARKILGDEVLPLWSPDLPRGGASRCRAAPTGQSVAVYLPACVNTMFGPVAGGIGVQRSFEQLCERVGVTVLVPAAVDQLCCGTPWSSKGMDEGAAVVRTRTLAALREATQNGLLPVACDASSCSEGSTPWSCTPRAPRPGSASILPSPRWRLRSPIR